MDMVRIVTDNYMVSTVCYEYAWGHKFSFIDEISQKSLPQNKNYQTEDLQGSFAIFRLNKLDDLNYSSFKYIYYIKKINNKQFTTMVIGQLNGYSLEFLSPQYDNETYSYDNPLRFPIRFFTLNQLLHIQDFLNDKNS